MQVVLVERASENTKSLTELVGHEVACFTRTTAEDALKAVPGIIVVNEGTLQDQMKAIDRGELRAVGAFTRDHLLFMARVGFDAFELRDGEDAHAALAAFEEFSVSYQRKWGQTPFQR